MGLFIVEYTGKTGVREKSAAMPENLANRYASTVKSPTLVPVEGEATVNVTVCRPGTAAEQIESTRHFYGQTRDGAPFRSPDLVKAEAKERREAERAEAKKAREAAEGLARMLADKALLDLLKK